ncbi:hypothetical protein B0E37_06332 [Streptomyces sp. MH192]|nr:hypothetical protein [Streptomyces sp. MH192]MCF0103765.1 hypothetical protein [Streptomyces sp. MH191]
MNPYWSSRSDPSPATICVPPKIAVILLWQVRSAAQNAATVVVISSRIPLCSSTLSPSYSQSSSSLTELTNVVAFVFSSASFDTSGRISVAYDDNAEDTVSRSVANSSARSFTGFVDANNCSASGAL